MTAEEIVEALLPITELLSNLGQILSGIILFLGLIFGIIFIKTFLERFGNA